MNYIISYDITSDKLRNRIAKKLQSLGCFRLQKSVFIGVAFNQRAYKQLKTAIVKILQSKLKKDSDSLLCLPITGTQKEEMWWLSPIPKPTYEFGNALFF